MRTRFVLLTFVICVLASGAGLALVIMPENSSIDELPTPLVFVSATVGATSTATPTWNITPSSTPSATVTPLPTATATLDTRVAQAQIIMPDVTLPPTVSPLPDDLYILTESPEPVEPLPNATLLPFPYTDFIDWVAFESDHPAMRYTQGEWAPIGSLQASQGQYHYSEDADARVSFTFSGEAIRVRYVGFTNGGIWNVIIDSNLVQNQG